MADLDPRQMFERLEGATPRPEFVAELRAVIEEEVRAQSDVAVAAPVDVSVVDPAIDIERKKRMSKNVWIGLAAAAVVVVVGLLLWVQGGESASELDTVDDVETEEVEESLDGEQPEATTTTSTTTTAAPEVVPAPLVDRPDPAPPVEASTLAFDEWLVEFAAYAENRHEGDWLHFSATSYGEQIAITEGEIQNRAGYAFTTQCDLLPVTSGHLAEAPGLPENSVIAEAYQDLLDQDSVTWGFVQAKCDAVDHDLARQGLAETLSLDTSSDFSRGGGICEQVRRAIEEEVGVTTEFPCRPPADFAIDREMPDGLRALAG